MRKIEEIANDILIVSRSLAECEKSIDKYEFTSSICVKRGNLPHHSENVELLYSVMNPKDIIIIYIEECKRRLIELKQELNETN